MESQETRVQTKDITVTPEAAEQIRIIQKENQVPDSHGLRIGIQGSGCCGPSYVLAFDEKADETDKVFLSHGISIFVDGQSFEGLSGTTLEYIDGPQGKGFRFDNPNVSKSCGCEGESCSEDNCGNGECSDGGCGCH